MIRQMLEGTGGRRFAATIGACAVTSVLQWFGKLDAGGTAYAAVVIGTLGAYIAGNTTQKIKQPQDGAQ